MQITFSGDVSETWFYVILKHKPFFCDLEVRCSNFFLFFREEITSKFDKILLNLKTLEKYATDSVIFLPSYDVRQSQQALQKVQDLIWKKHGELIPKKKFAFKARTNISIQASVKDAVEKGQHVEEKQDKNKPNVENDDKTSIGQPVTFSDFGFSDEKHSELVLTAEKSRQKDIKLSNLEHCIVKIYGCPSVIHVSNLRNCKVFCGPICRALFVADCIECQFSLACQQLRIHTTSKTTFSIHVTGKAIIEDCKEIGFAPYNWSYEGLVEHFLETGLNTHINKWNDVDDFNWLKLDEQSPNWYIIPEEERTHVKET